MKNVVTKFDTYKDYGLFNHIYLLDVDCTLNEKMVVEIIRDVNNEPFFKVMIHTNDISHEVIYLFKRLSETKDVWLQSDELLFEDFAVMSKDSIKVIGFNKITVMIDALGDEIDIKQSLEKDELVKFVYEKCPF